MLALALLLACADDDAPERVEPSFIEVSLVDPAAAGRADEPLAFTSETVSRAVQVRTLDRNADPYPLSGDLRLGVRPGRFDGSRWLTVIDGEWTGEVTFHSAYGPTRIWVSDEGDRASDSEREATWATGVSEAIWYATPTIAELQRHEDHATNQLDREFADVRVADRNVVVTALGTAGFWCTDLDDGEGAYNSLFVYTFGAPSGVEVGSRLTKLNGNDQEYLQTTQLSFPSYEVDEATTLAVPDPVPLGAAATCDDDAMEALESALVAAVDAGIPSDFVEGSEDYADYLEYGQWPIELAGGGCRIYASSGSVAPDFDPTAHVGELIGEVDGLLSEIFGKWVITARSDADVGDGFEEDRRRGAAAGQAASQPMDRRPARPEPRRRDGSPQRLGAAGVNHIHTAHCSEND